MLHFGLFNLLLRNNLFKVFHIDKYIDYNENTPKVTIKKLLIPHNNFVIKIFIFIKTLRKHSCSLETNVVISHKI